MNTYFIDCRHAKLVALAITALPLYVGIGHAQTSTTTTPSASRSLLLPLSRPSLAMTPNPPAPYRSALDGYKAYTDEKIIDWKQANDTTGRIGGWREYAKEAQQTDARDEGSKPAPDVKPAPDAKTVKP